MRIIVKMKFGAHLYGTATSDSDLDYKGIFLPTKEQLLLGRVPKSHNYSSGKDDSRNTKNDVDTELYSLHYFIKLACAGQTVAMDMLHAPNSMILKKEDPSKRMREVWRRLPRIEHCYDVAPDPNGMRQYQVCGKSFQESATIGYVIPIIEKFYDDYGRRAKLAAENKNIDWKAVSHALRAAYQTKEILTENPRVGSSILSLGTIKSSREIPLELFMFGADILGCCLLNSQF